MAYLPIAPNLPNGAVFNADHLAHLENGILNANSDSREYIDGVAVQIQAGQVTDAAFDAAVDRAAADGRLVVEGGGGEAAGVEVTETQPGAYEFVSGATAATVYGLTSEQKLPAAAKSDLRTEFATNANLDATVAGNISNATTTTYTAVKSVADGSAQAVRNEVTAAGYLTTVPDTSVAALVQDGATATGTALGATIQAKTGVTTSDPAHTTKLIPGAGKNGLFVRNEQAKYAVKIDQYAPNGVHDAVNIAANFTGAHTPFSVNSQNTTLSTVKIVNSAAQTGGAIIAAVGDNAARTAELYGADNYGLGPSYLTTMKAGSDGIAVRAAYDPGAYTKSVLWATAHHTGGHLLHVENDGAHTSGSMLRLSQTNASSTVSAVSINNAGTGESITAPSFNVLKDGRVKLGQIENLSTFSNGTVRMQAGGVLVERSANDASPVLRVQNSSASGTGDIAQFIRTGGDVTTRVNRNGALVSKSSIAPADTDLANNEMVFWYDAPASAFRVKAKDANGLVKTGTVTLA